MKTLDYFKANAEENYNTTPISVLRYITELEIRVNHQPPTAQQATSKSLDEQSCIDLIEFIRSETTVNMGENGKEIDWTNKEKDCIKHIKNLFAHQPYPQDSSSGEVEEIKGVKQEIKDILDRNYNGTRYLKTDYPEWLLRSMDEIAYSKPVKKHWFLTYEAKQRLATPPASESPCEKCKGEDGNGLEGFTCTKCGRAFKNNHEVSESLEQAARKLINLVRTECFEGTQKGTFMYDHEGAIKLAIDFAQSTQQQKPLFVLPSNFDLIDKYGTRKYGTTDVIEHVNPGNFYAALDEIRELLSAANGVDLQTWEQWKHENKFTYEGDGIYKQVGHVNSYKRDLKYVMEKYLTEQSQQQNKGNGQKA